MAEFKQEAFVVENPVVVMDVSTPAQPAASTTAAADNSDFIDAEKRILELCAQHPDGISDHLLKQLIPQISNEQRQAALNRLSSLNKVDFLRSSQGIFFRLKDNSASHLPGSSTDDERLVYTIIKEAGNKGIWIRDISTKINVKSMALNKVLKNLESKKIIKSVASVNASKKKVYMLFELEPDRSLTGGAWYSGKEFESEFVEILNEQCYHYLLEKRNSVMGAGKAESTTTTTAAAVGALSTGPKFSDPLARKKASFATSKELRDYIKNLGISRVELNVEDIETILNTLVFDGKAEKSVVISPGGDQTTNLYRAVNPVLVYEKGSSLMRTPCGICPLIANCHPDGLITPLNCHYMRDWLDF